MTAPVVIGRELCSVHNEFSNKYGTVILVSAFTNKDVAPLRSTANQSAPAKGAGRPVDTLPCPGRCTSIAGLFTGCSR